MMDSVAQQQQQHEHRQQQQQQHYSQVQPPMIHQEKCESNVMSRPQELLPSTPTSSLPIPQSSGSVINESGDHRHHHQLQHHRDHQKNENVTMSSSDFKGGGGETHGRASSNHVPDNGESGRIIVNNTTTSSSDNGMNCDSNGNNDCNNKIDHNKKMTDDHHDNNNSNNNNKSDILLYSNDYNNSSNINNSNKGSINCDHIETTKLSIDLDKTITKSIILRQNSNSSNISNSIDNNVISNEMKSKIQHSNNANTSSTKSSENHMSYHQQQQQAAAYHYHQHQQQQQQQQHHQQQHQHQQQHHHQQQQQHHAQQRPINSLYVNNPDFSKTLQTSSSSSPSLVKMKPPDFSKVIINSNKSNDLQIANPDFSKMGPSSSSPNVPPHSQSYRPDRPTVNPSNFAEISKKYNYISDLQLKKPIGSGHSPSSTPIQQAPYPNLYVKAPDFSAPKHQNKYYPDQPPLSQHQSQQQQSVVQKPPPQAQPSSSSSTVSSQYDCEPTAHVIHKYPYINNVPQRSNPLPPSTGREYPPHMSQQQYDLEQISRRDHERKQEEEYYRKQYAAHYYNSKSVAQHSISPQQPHQQPQQSLKQQQAPQPQQQQLPTSTPPERYYQQDYKSSHSAVQQAAYNQQKYYGHSQYPQTQTNVIQPNIANQYSKTNQQANPYHHSPQVQSKTQSSTSSGLMNPPQNWPNPSKVDASRSMASHSPIVHQPSPTHHQNIPSPVNSYKSTSSPHSNVPSPKMSHPMSNSPFSGYSHGHSSSSVSGSSNSSGGSSSVPIKYENYPPPQLKQQQQQQHQSHQNHLSLHAPVDYVDLTSRKSNLLKPTSNPPLSDSNLKFHPKFASTGTLNANHSNHNMEETNLTRSLDGGRYGHQSSSNYPETRHSSVDINYYNKALHPDVSIRVSDEKINSYHHQYPQQSSNNLRSSSTEANLNKNYYSSGQLVQSAPPQRVPPQMHQSQSVKYSPKPTPQQPPQQMIIQDNYTRPSAVVTQSPRVSHEQLPIDPYMKNRYPQSQQHSQPPPLKIDRPRPSETVTSRSGIKYNDMYSTNPTVMQHHQQVAQSQPLPQQPLQQVAPAALPPIQSKIIQQPNSSSVVSSTTKKDIASPLDLSVKTIKTKADSTGDDLKIIPSNSALKVDFQPNFSKHGIGAAYHQDQSRSSSSSSSTTSRATGPLPTPNISTFYDKKSDIYLTNTPQHTSKAVDVPYISAAPASSSTVRPVNNVDQSNYVSKKSMAKSYSSQVNNSGTPPQYPPPVPERKCSSSQPPVIVNNRDKNSLQYQQDRKLVENILKRNMSINPFSYSGSFNHTSSKSTAEPKIPPNEKSGIYSTATSSQSNRKRAAEPLPHEASLPPVKHSRSDHPQKTVTEVYENLLESMNKNKENPYQRNNFPEVRGHSNYQPTQHHPQHLAPQQPQVSSNRYQYPYPTKEGSSSQKQSHQIYYQTSSEYQNAQQSSLPKNYLPPEPPMRPKESVYPYQTHSMPYTQPDRYYPNHHPPQQISIPPNHKIVEPIPQTPRHSEYYNHAPQQLVQPVQSHHPQPTTTLTHTQSTASFQVIHPTNHNRDVAENHISHPPVVSYPPSVGYHRQHTDQTIRTIETNIKNFETYTVPINGNSNPVLLPSPKGADQTVISKLRTSLEMKEIEKQKLLKRNSLEMIAPIPNVNHQVTPISNTSPLHQPATPLVPSDRMDIENETESTNDSRRSNDMNSILAARIRTKGELKGFIPIPQPQLSTISRNGELEIDNENSRLSNKTLEPTSDMEGMAKFDLMDWDKACNGFVEELQTGESRIKKPVRKRQPKPKGPVPKLETVEKEIPLVETTTDLIQENQVDIVKSENKDYNNLVKNSEKSSSSSDEDKPLYFLKQSQESSNTIKKETTVNDDDSQSSINKSKRSSLNDRSSKEKQRLEREKRLAARLGSSSSDSETDAHKMRTRKRIRKPKSRSSIAMKSRTSVESSEDDKPIKPKLELSQSMSQINLCTEKCNENEKANSSDSEPIAQIRKKSLRVVSENEDPNLGNVVVKKEETTEVVNTLIATPSVEISPVSKEPESKRIATTRTSRSSTRNSISNQDEETPTKEGIIKKEGEDPEKAHITPKSKVVTKKNNTSGTKTSVKLSPPALTSRVAETPSPLEETMTRSKRKREIEQQLSNSKVLRNDKVVKNIQFESRSKPVKSSTGSESKTKIVNSNPIQGTSCSNAKAKRLDDSKRKTMESEGEADMPKSGSKNKRLRRGSKAQKSCSSSSSEQNASSSSTDANESEHEHGVAERLRPRKAKTNSVGEEKAKPASQPKSSTGAETTKAKAMAKDDKSLINCKTNKATPVKKGQAIKTETKTEPNSTLPSHFDGPKNGIIDDTNQKFHPGWEEEFYQYKRALKVPPSLISVRHRISTSLPDLDHSSDASECFSACSGDKTPRPNQKQSVETQTVSSRSTPRKTNSLNSTPVPTPPFVIKTEVVIPEALPKSKSIIELLHQRVSRPPVKPKKITKSNNEPKLLPRSTESELLATPGAVNDSIFGGHKLFETPVLKSRTRTEHRVLKTKEIIREVFGGEDRPASAPPLGQEINSENELTPECMTFDQKYSQYLQKMNVDFIDKINAKTINTTTVELKVPDIVIKQECDETTILSEATIKQEPLEQPPTCDTPSVTSERNTVTPVLFRTLKAKKKGNRSCRRKGSSGFDYIRKKKKPSSSQNAGTSQADIQSEINKKKKIAAMHEKLMQEKDENDVSREVRGWVLNKGVGESVLHKAARLGYIDAIAYCLIRMDMDPDPKDNAGYTPLHEACSRGHLEIARLLLQHGANPSSTAQSGFRPLHEAIENNYIEIVRLLLSYGADPLLATYSGQTPLNLSETEEMTSFLKAHLYDIQNTSPLKSSWKFTGPWCRYDPDTEGYEVLAEAPAPDPEDASVECEGVTSIKINGSDTVSTVQSIETSRIEIKTEMLTASTESSIAMGCNGTIVSTSSVIKMNSTVVLPSKLNKNKNYTGILNSLCPAESLVQNSLVPLNDNNNNSNHTDDDDVNNAAAGGRTDKSGDNANKLNVDECDNVSGDDLFEIEESENPLPPLYLLKDEGTDKWVLLSDLCNLLKVKSKDTLLKQICPSSPPSICNKELLRELKMSDFLEKATCLQLLCAGEKLNIRASKVVLVRYNDSVRTLLGVKTFMMTM